MAASADCSCSVRSFMVAGSGGASDHVEMNAGDVIGVPQADGGRHMRAPVAALRPVALVAEPGHQLIPGVGDALDTPARPRWLAAEPVAGQRRADHVEGVGGIAAVRGRVGQRADHLAELHDRAGPAVRQHERQRVLVRRADVQEVDVEAVDLGPELREARSGSPRTRASRSPPASSRTSRAHNSAARPATSRRPSPAQATASGRAVREGRRGRLREFQSGTG